MSTVSQLLGEYAAGPRRSDHVHRHAAARAFLDTLASAMSGRREPSQRLTRDWAHNVIGAPGAPTARDWVSGARLLASEAAFANGVTAHALDFDDVSMAMSGHPSALLVPVAAALSEATGASVEQMLDAYVTGLHVNIAAAAGFDLAEHYQRGWHASVTVGMLGAAATACHLLELNVKQTNNAIGIAASMASGTKQNFGTMTKALHIGLAASNAVRAAQLAALGVDSSDDALDGPLGFYALYGTPHDSAAAVAEALAVPEEESLASLNVKRYPCCYLAHRAIDAALDLRSQLEKTLTKLVTEDAIDEVVVCVNPGSDSALIHPYATTPTQARFCMRYVVAAALLRGHIGFDTFISEEVASEDLQALMLRIRLERATVPPYEKVPYSSDYAAVSVTTKTGQSLDETCVAPRGSAERPLSDAELLAKADDCLRAADMRPAAAELAAVLDVPTQHSATVIDTLRGLDKSDETNA